MNYKYDFFDVINLLIWWCRDAKQWVCAHKPQIFDAICILASSILIVIALFIILWLGYCIIPC